MVPVITSPFSYLIQFTGVFSFLMSLANGFPILFIFIKKQFLFHEPFGCFLGLNFISFWFKFFFFQFFLLRFFSFSFFSCLSNTSRLYTCISISIYIYLGLVFPFKRKLSLLWTFILTPLCCILYFMVAGTFVLLVYRNLLISISDFLYGFLWPSISIELFNFQEFFNS